MYNSTDFFMKYKINLTPGNVTVDMQIHDLLVILWCFTSSLTIMVIFIYNKIFPVSVNYNSALF